MNANVADNFDGRHTGKFFEEFVANDNGYVKGLGIQIVESNSENRPLGVAGKREFVLTQPIIVVRGGRPYHVFASAKRPLRVETYLNRLGGR